MTLFIFEASLFAFAAGMVYGIFGGGSGLFLMPGFYFLLRHFPSAGDSEMQVAVATCAATSAILGIMPSWMQWKQANIDFMIVKRVFWGILLGTILAVSVINIIPSHLLKHAFGFVVILVAAWFWFYNQEKDNKQWSFHSWTNHLMTTLIGLLWYLLGIAVFTVPYLHKCGVSMRRSVGTGTFLATLFSAIAAVLFMVSGSFRLGISLHHLGYVNTTLMLFAVLPSMIAAYLGAKISFLLPQRTLKKIFSVLVLVIGIIMLA